MIEFLGLLLVTLVGTLRSRQRLLLENLLLRQQLQVALRCQRRSRLRTRDKLFWLVVRRLHRNWRRHLLLVRPETVLRWHRHGWRLFGRWRSGRSLGRPRLKPEVRTLILGGLHDSTFAALQRRSRRDQAHCGKPPTGQPTTLNESVFTEKVRNSGLREMRRRVGYLKAFGGGGGGAGPAPDVAEVLFELREC